MLTVEDLYEFAERLEDLTREADDPLDIVTEATKLIEEDVSQRLAMQRRAAAAADAHYLRGVSFSKIAKMTGHTPQTPLNWVDEYGPKHYLAITAHERKPNPDPGPWGETETWSGELRLIAIDGGDQVIKRKLREHQRSGWRIAPAILDLVDPNGPDGLKPLHQWPMTYRELWEKLGD